MIIPLSKLTQLTDLTLIGYRLTPTLARACSLASVTSLTVCSHRSGQLLSRFNLTEPDQLEPNALVSKHKRHFAVEPFCLALFSQFPNLQNLTLVGNMRRHELVCEQLRAQLGPRLVRLALFIEEFDPLYRPVKDGSERALQTARKSTGGQLAERRMLATRAARRLGGNPHRG